MKYFVLLIATVCISFANYAASIPSPEGSYNKEAVDCKWTDWIDGKCVVTKGNLLRRSESRFKKPGQNGGKDCEGEAKRLDKSCSESEYMAQVFINTFTQGGKPPPGARSKKNKTTGDSDKGIDSSNPNSTKPHHYAKPRHFVCSTSRAAPSGKWRISGRGGGCYKPKPAAEPSPPFPSPELAPKPAPEGFFLPRSRAFPGLRSRAFTRGKREIEDSPETEEPSDTQTYKGNQTLDILFLIDESGSVGRNNFIKEVGLMRETIKKLCGKIEVSPDKTRVGLTTFDMAIHDFIKFNESTDINGILEKLDGVRYNRTTQGGTCLVNALQHVRRNLFTKEAGARDNDDLYDLVVLITDGCANCAGNLDFDLQNEVNKYDEQGITLMLVTISDSSHCSERISKLAYGNHCFLNYEIDNWYDFDNFVDDIKNIDCQDQWKLPETSCP